MQVGRSSEAATGAQGTAALAVPGKATLTGDALREEAEAGVAGAGGGALPVRGQDPGVVRPPTRPAAAGQVKLSVHVPQCAAHRS